MSTGTDDGTDRRRARPPARRTAPGGGVRILLAAARRRPGLLVLLVALDGLLVALHLARHSDLAPRWAGWLTSRARLDVEVGPAERYGYVKIAAVVVGLVLLARASDGVGRWLFRAWAATYAVVLLDDALGLHERGGTWMADRWDLGGGAVGSAQDVGEVLTWAGLYAAPLVVLVALHRASGPPARDRSNAVWVAAAALAFCAVALDLAHASTGGGAGVLLGAAEDGGEHLVLSVTLCAVAGMRPGAAPMVEPEPCPA